jgi:hypothetical protein
MYNIHFFGFANIIETNTDDGMDTIINSGYFTGEELNKYIKQGYLVKIM